MVLDSQEIEDKKKNGKNMSPVNAAKSSESDITLFLL